MVFANMAEIEHALETQVRHAALAQDQGALCVAVDEEGNEVSEVYETTPGRMMLGEILPKRSNIPYDLWSTGF